MNLKDPKYYINRELSWLKFNDRVLEEAESDTHPLLERLKFISIFSSNLDEFFMIRVAGLKDQIHAGVHDIAADGLEPEELVERIAVHVHHSVSLQAEILQNDILPQLKKKGIRLRAVSSLRNIQKEYLEQYFQEKVYPLLTPLAIDPAHPFPQLKGLGLNLFVELRMPYQKIKKVAVVHIPPILPRFISLPTDNGTHDFVVIEDLIRKYVHVLFPNMKVVNISEFRITRNADLDLSEAEADDLLKLIERELRKRRIGTVIRLEISQDMSPANREFLKKMTGLKNEDMYDIPTYLDLSAFMYLHSLNFPELKDKKFTPALNQHVIKQRNIFAAIREGDVLLHHPYDSFNHVIDFIHEAARDPKVLAIKQTLYRTSGKSPIVSALKQAVENGKQVTALIELKARFDEENNIGWAKELDRAGVNVVYGLLGLKTHCKICMVVRQEEDTIRRYLHLSTGNYNATTAKIYTDLGLLTCDQDMGMDASGLFNLLTGYSLQDTWNKFLIAPSNLRGEMVWLIQHCVQKHSEEDPSHIIMVINSLVDPQMIRELYKASIKGVKIELIIRGICCLIPGMKGISENITVKSIVGRFLEHCRIYYFMQQGQTNIYLGSADLMQRNLDRRVELVFPVEDPRIKHYVGEIIQALKHDNVKSRIMHSDGTYTSMLEHMGTDTSRNNVHNELLLKASEKQKFLDTINTKKLVEWEKYK